MVESAKPAQLKTTGWLSMSTLIEHYTLEDGKEWAVLADGGSQYENIQTYVCVPADDLGKPAEELGKAVASLRFAAEATRLKCAWLHSMMPDTDSVTLLEITNRNLEEASHFSKEGSESLLEATPQQTAFPASIRPYSRNEGNAVVRTMEWHPMVGLKVMFEMKSELEGRLREEYFDLLRLRESRPKKRLTPSKASRLAEVTKALGGCKLCGLIDGNHTDVCRAMSARLEAVAT
jgi:hypothetical protein